MVMAGGVATALVRTRHHAPSALSAGPVGQPTPSTSRSTTGTSPTTTRPAPATSATTASTAPAAPALDKAALDKLVLRAADLLAGWVAQPYSSDPAQATNAAELA